MHGGSDAVTEEVTEAELHIRPCCRSRTTRTTTTDLAGDLVTERIPAEVLTIPQAAERLKVSRNTVYRLISAGDLPAVTVGSVQRVSEADLQAYIQRNTRVAS